MVRVYSSTADVILKDAEQVGTALQTRTCAVPVLVGVHVVQHALGWVSVWEPVFQVRKSTPYSQHFEQNKKNSVAARQ